MQIPGLDALCGKSLLKAKAFPAHKNSAINHRWVNGILWHQHQVWIIPSRNHPPLQKTSQPRLVLEEHLKERPVHIHVALLNAHLPTK